MGTNLVRMALDNIMSEWQISEISAVVLTHCEHLSEEEREKMIEQFKKDHPSVAELMGKGILAVGFPDSSHIQPGSGFSQSVEIDENKMRQFIYSCGKDVIIPHSIPGIGRNNSYINAQNNPFIENRQLCYCSIL